ncbi:MAG: S-methyl-5-thioribose-1-phosphate isomerase [Ruminococcus sp.]|nr:S-methyl-5-thioribose-1-phosphate isomerase [Ruminococcus sp.]
MTYYDTDPVRLSDNGRELVYIDQRLLPEEIRYVSVTQAFDMYNAIKTLSVRGAPCIGIFAAYCVYVRSLYTDDDRLDDELITFCDYLASSRPTAVNLFYALDKMKSALEKSKPLSADKRRAALKEEAQMIHKSDIDTCQKIAEYGLTLVKENDGIITHCNAGALATSRLGTGLGTLLLAAERGIKLRPFVDETRPLLQGARLTAFELERAGLEPTLICDDMAAFVMSKGLVDAVFIGADRIAANGDTANKIGSLMLAITAKHYGVPFYVFAPMSTVDAGCKTGADINIELRDGEEIKSLYFERPIAPEGVKCLNPAFDVVENSLITAIITENGIHFPPYSF